MKNVREIAEEAVEVLRLMNPTVLGDIKSVLKKESFVIDALAFMTNDYDYKKSLSEYSEEEKDLADAIAERLVYGGEFDTNITYWDNFSNIYNEITSADCEPDIYMQ